jgi:hypothetical protein
VKAPRYAFKRCRRAASSRRPAFEKGQSLFPTGHSAARLQQASTSSSRIVGFGSRAVKLPVSICSPDCPRQQTLAWRAGRKYHLLRRWNCPQISRVGGQARTLRSDPRDQPPQRHGTSSDRAHVICQTTRVAAFGLAAGFHIMSTADRPPGNASLSPATGDPPLGLLSQVT